MFRNIIRIGVLLLCMALSSAAVFAESVVLLATDGVGDKAMIDEILAEQLQKNPSYDLKPPREIGISDLILGAGCEYPNESCMEKLSALIEADRLVFAKLGDTLSLRIFDFKEKRFLFQKMDIPVGEEDEIKAQIQSAIFGNVGEISVDVSPGNAEIFLDGETQGISPQTLQNLPLGKHSVLVRADDGSEQTRDVVLEPGTAERLSFTLGKNSQSKGSSSSFVKMLPGIGVIAVGIVGIGFGVTQSLEVQGFQDDLAEQERIDPVFADGRVTQQERPQISDKWFAIHDAERESNAAMLQWVGYGVGAVGIGLGSYLLISAMGDSAEVSISPNPSRPSASVKIKF